VMKKAIVKIIAIIETGIGLATLAGATAVQFWGIFGLAPKPLNVYIIVLIAAASALILGLGLLLGKEWARILLMFFAGYILLTKLLIYLGLMSFTGAVITAIPAGVKDGISVIYHAFLVTFLHFSRDQH
jgi:hypothetical protein